MERLSRRVLITGLIAFAAAPAIVRAESLMKVKAVKELDYKSIMNQIYTSVDFGLQDYSVIMKYEIEENGKIIIKHIKEFDFYKGGQWQ